MLTINDLNNVITFSYNYWYYGNPTDCQITYTKKQ